MDLKAEVEVLNVRRQEELELVHLRDELRMVLMQIGLQVHVVELALLVVWTEQADQGLELLLHVHVLLRVRDHLDVVEEGDLPNLRKVVVQLLR